MLVWLNGPFGGGKTQTAHELHRRVEGSVVCDPELAGFGLHRMMPRELRGDFQDLGAWRSGVAEVLALIDTAHPGPVIVPMTLVDRQYFDEVIGRLRREGHDVRHFSLLAERATVLRRLRERGLGRLAVGLTARGSLRRESFALEHLDRCLISLRAPIFAEHVPTDTRTIDDVVEHVAEASGLRLSQGRDGPRRAALRRARVGVRHIRWG